MANQNNDVNIKVGIQPDTAQGAQKAAGDIDKVAQSAVDGEKKSKKATKSWGDQFEGQLGKKVYGARGAVRALSGAVAQLGLGLSVWAIAASGVEYFISKIKEAKRELDDLKKAKEKTLGQNAISGEFIKPEDLQNKINIAKKTAGKDIKADKIAEMFSVKGASQLSDNQIRQVIQIAKIKKADPSAVAEQFLNGDISSIAESLGMSKETVGNLKNATLTPEQEQKYRTQFLNLAAMRAVKGQEILSPSIPLPKKPVGVKQEDWEKSLTASQKQAIKNTQAYNKREMQQAEEGIRQSEAEINKLSAGESKIQSNNQSAENLMKYYGINAPAMQKVQQYIPDQANKIFEAEKRMENKTMTPEDAGLFYRIDKLITALENKNKSNGNVNKEQRNYQGMN